MEKAISLMCGADARPVPTAHEVDYAPAREEAPIPPSNMGTEPRSFKPAVVYNLADGSAHVIPAGLYTEDEFFSKTLQAQELVAENAKAQASSSSLSKASMSKYESPLTRSDSQIDGMENAEALKSQIAHKAERARNVMEASRSKDSSPVLEGTKAPAPPATPDVVRLGASLADVSVDDKADQMAKWDAAGATLAASAAAVWGGNGAGLRP